MKNSFLSRARLLIASVVVFGTGCSTLGLDGATSHRELVLEPRLVRETAKESFLGYRRLNRMSPLLTERFVVHGNAVDGLSVFQRDTGKKVWKLEIENGVEGGVELSGETLYFGGGDGLLRAVNLADGKVLWTTPTRAELLAPPTLENSNLYVQTGADVIYGLEAATGKLLWTYNRQVTGNLSVRSSSRPVIAGESLLVGFSDGYVVSLRKRDGVLQWERKLGRGNRFRDVDTTAVIDGDKTYVASFDGTLACIRIATGDLLWQADLSGYLPVTLGTGAFSDRLYFSTVDGRVVELDRSTGKETRSVRLSAGIATQPVQSQNLLIFAESEGAVRVLDLERLNTIAQYQTGIGVLSTPTYDKKQSELWFVSSTAHLYGMKMAFRRIAERYPWKQMTSELESESF